MSAILALLSSAGILKWLGIALVSLGGLAAAWFHGKSSGTKAAADDAQAKVDAATSAASTSQAQAAQATADAQQAREALAASQTAEEAKQAAQAIPDDQLDAEGAKLGIVRSE